METQSSNYPHQQKHAGEPHVQAKHPSPSSKRRWILGGALLLVVIVPYLTVRVWKKMEEPKQAEARRLDDECKKAKQAAAEAKKQLDQEEMARKAADVQRKQALAAEKAARRSQQVTQTVLAFLQKNVLSPGNDKGWGSVPSGKDVTLRQAVNLAEPKITDAFADHPLAEASIRQIFGATYMDLGDAAKAVKQLKRSLVLRESEFGPDHPDTSECRNRLAVALRRDGRTDEAAALFQQNRLSSSHAAALAIRGSALLAERNPIGAESKLRQSLELRQRMQPDDWTTFDSQSMLGAALLDQKKYAAAERLLLSGYQGMKQRESKIPMSDRSHLVRAHERLVHLYEAWGKPDEAARWRKTPETHDHDTVKKP